MSQIIDLTIVSPGAPDLVLSVQQFYLPGYLGQTGILESHRPYMTLVEEGVLSYTDPSDQRHSLYLREGFLEVHDNHAVLITDGFQKGTDIDLNQVRSRLAELDKKIKDLTKGQGDHTELDSWLDEQHHLSFLETAASKS